MYKQTIQNIEVAVLSLDGVILDLNRMRYNYYNHLCKDHHIQIDKLEFHQNLSNMYDMYTKLPLHDCYESGVLNAKIERELFQYLKYSGVKVKDGIYELIEYFHQKNIKIAIVATHHTKNAVEYLKLAGLYEKVHFIVGSDSRCIPLPSNQMLEAIKNHFQVETHHILVVSSFTALQKAAIASKMNIIHCDDLVETSIEDKQTCYKCVSDVFEVLNTLLFDKYEEEMYSSILGMNHSMSHYELDETYKNLNEKYSDDREILDIVDQTYQYHVSKLDDHHIKDASILKNKPRKFVFDEDEEKEDVIEETKEYVVEETKETSEAFDEIFNTEEETKEEQSTPHIKQLDKEEEDELSNLLKQLSHKDKTPAKNNEDTFITNLKLSLESEEDEDEKTETPKNKDNLFVVILFELISAMLSSICTLFAGIIIAVMLMPQWGKDGIFSIIENIYHVYTSIVSTCFEYIFDTLHIFINSIPSYVEYMHENPIFSSSGVELLNMFIFNTIIIFVVRIIVVCIGRNKNDRED